MNYRIFNVRTDVDLCDCTWGCTDDVRESALTVDPGRKIPRSTGESNLRQRCAGPTLYQLSLIPIPVVLSSSAILLLLVLLLLLLLLLMMMMILLLLYCYYYSYCCYYYYWWRLRLLMVGFSSHARLRFFFFSKWRLAFAHRIHSSGQDHSTVAQDLRWLRPSVLRRVACELVSLIGSHTRPRQHSQPTPTSFGHRCMCDHV